MRPAPFCRAVLVAFLAAVCGAEATAADGDETAAVPLIYGLTGDPAAEQMLFAARWGSPSPSLRLDTAAGLGPHEVRVLSVGSSLRWTPQQLGLGAAPPSEVGIELVRATYRYTLLAKPNWEMKLGLSANLGDPSSVATASTLAADRSGFGSLPLVHLAGVGHWSERWRVAFAADGLATARGRALDLGVQVDYLWSPAMSLFGGYQVTDSAGDAEGYYGGMSNRANIGVRYRF